jgi:beta-galactosidase/beta-glucuronidase
MATLSLTTDREAVNSAQTSDAPLELESIPRPEYPRPQFERKEWLNLNGQWEFRIDDAIVGLDEKWFMANVQFPLEILVPFAAETPLSGIHERGFHPCVWYRRRFAAPAEWMGRRILLNFGAVDYRAMVWVNETIVAMHEGGHSPFSCEITGQVRGSGENVIAVRAEDPPTDRYIPRGKQHWEEEAGGIYYARTTGIWQTVWLEPAAHSYLKDVRMTPRIDGSVRFEGVVINPQPFQYIAVEWKKEGKSVATGIGIVDGDRALVEAQVAGPQLWSPDTPNLYEVTIELHSDRGPLDKVRSYLGFRKIGTEGGAVFLNGQRLFLRTVLDQGYWPESNLTPPSDEAIQADIRIAKELGFNGVRKHQKAEDPRFLYWADRLGLLVSAEMANAYLYDHEAAARVTREWIDLVNRDYNHPSIVIWVPVNESWGVPNLTDPTQQAHLRALYYLTKSLDDTRLVIDNDGWEHTEATDLFAIHDYTPAGEEFERRYRNIGKDGIPLPLFGKMYLAPGHKYNGSPIFLSEFGGVGYILPEDRRAAAKDAWGYSGLESAAEQALARMRSLFAAIASIPEIAGICYTQLYDVEQEVNGLLTYDRRLKFPAGAINEIVSLTK